MRGRRRRYIPILLFLGVALAQGCVDPVGDDNYDNPFDPAHPASPFRHQVQPHDGVGEMAAPGDVVSLSCAWDEIGEAMEYEIQWTHTGSFDAAEIETSDVAAVSLQVPNDSSITWRVRYRAEATLPGETEAIAAWSPWHGPWSMDVNRDTASDDDDDDEDDDAETEQVAEPQFSSSGGTYTTDQSVTITTETADATIYYTTDGSDPVVGAAATTEYNGSISVAGDGTSRTIKAMAVADGYTDSTVTEATYTIAYDQVSTPQFSPGGGTYDSDQNVAITTETADATIYYTTDGSDPTSSSTQYVGPISMAGDGTSVTIRAIAVRSDYTDSTVAEASFIIAYDQVSTSQFSPAGGTYGSDQSVTITTDTVDATIYYTTDGSDPTTSSTEYAGPISVAGDGTAVTIRAVGVLAGYSDSAITEASYTIDYPPQATAPQFTPGGGTYNSDQSVQITIATTGATIYYTTDGSDPTTASTEYAGPISVAGDGTNVTIRAFAVLTGYSDSTIAEASYTIEPYVIGDIGPAGGHIFYDDEADGIDDIPGARYLEAAPAATEWDNKPWGGYGTEVGAVQGAVGTGAANTAAIVAAYGETEPSQGRADYAAKLAADLSYNGYDDWFLPSYDELDLMYTNLHTAGIGGFAFADYWSSTEAWSNIAWNQSFNSGNKFGDDKVEPGVRVRAVRAFQP